MVDRILKINKLIKQQLSQIFLNELEFPQGCLVTITKVQVSCDLKIAKVWLSIFPLEFSQKVLKVLNKKIGKIQRLLNKKLVFKTLPRLFFELDTTEAEAAEIEKLLDRIKDLD